MWESIADAQAAFTAANHGVPIEPIGPLPDLRVPTADPPYMLPNHGSNKARVEFTVQCQRIAARAVAAAAGPLAPPPLAILPPSLYQEPWEFALGVSDALGARNAN